MKQFPLITSLVASAAVLLCSAAHADETPVDPLFTALAGKTFYGQSDVTLTLHADGALTGGNDKLQIVGTWSVMDGVYCREISEPEPLRGKGCPTVTIDGDTATFTREDGSARAYQIR